MVLSDAFFFTPWSIYELCTHCTYDTAAAAVLYSSTAVVRTAVLYIILLSILVSYDIFTVLYSSTDVLLPYCCT